MAQDFMNQFYTCLNLPLYEKLRELTRIIDQSSPNKELQSLFPQLISNIFSSSFNSGWGLRSTTFDQNRGEFELLVSFLEPHGPMFRLCYKLLSDPLLKYNLPLNLLPQNLQLTLERGRCPQFYADLIHVDPQTMNVVALALNPFDYYIFNFALHLITNSPNKSYWENWNSVYFALACDYLMHFLPSDPNVTVLPLIPHYMGKVPVVAPLQTANRPLCSPSLLLIPDLSGISQQSPVQTQSRNEVWRSETLLQVFIDVWMSVEDYNGRSMELYQRNYSVLSSSPERVRTVRVLIKHIHSYSAKHLADPATRSSALRKYARQVMCARAYRYVKDLVATWPLDASFRLVMELWLSLIQPWRYAEGSINKDRFPNANNNLEEGAGSLDASYTQFIAENFPSYVCIFQLVLPRFARLDLTAYKNAVMLFRLGKVFSQPSLVAILRDLEHAMTEQNNGTYYSPENSWNTSHFDQSNSYNGVQTNKWVAVAKQALTEFNLSTNFVYEPIWGEAQKRSAHEFVGKIVASKIAAEKIVEECKRKINEDNQGIWASILSWLMISSAEDAAALEDCRRVPTYLAAAIHHMSLIFGLNENLLSHPEISVTDTLLEQSSFANSTNFANSITRKLRPSPAAAAAAARYRGDPDLAPIASYESTILVRILYQLASRLNEMYQEEFSSLWSRVDFWGYVAREILQRPCTIHTYVKDTSYHQNLVSHNLPARLSFRRLGSHACVVWLTLGYIIFRLFSYSGLFYAFFLCAMFVVYVLTKASLKSLKVLS